MSERFAIVEKSDHLGVHGLFYSRETAERFLAETVPVYVERSFYIDKSLTASSFEVIERPQDQNRKRSK